MTFQQYILGHVPLVLFTAKVTLLWMLANYTYPADSMAESGKGGKRGRYWIAMIAARSIALASVVAWIAGSSFVVGLFTLALSAILPLVRGLINSCYLAELEIGANLIFVSGVISLSFLEHLSSVAPAGSEAGTRQAAAVYALIAVTLFVMRGGSNIVRGILDKGQLLQGGNGQGGAPAKLGIEKRVPEYNRGRIVGIIERLMLMTFVAVQAYNALAFLLTAKGLFRSKELDDPAFAEYFLVGTLTSSMIAIAAGFIIQILFKLLW
jgi:hypothetical protein